MGRKMNLDTRDYAFSASVIPKLATIDKRYVTSGNWSANQQGNSDEAYLLSYSDHRFGEHTPDSQCAARTIAVTRAV